MKLTLTLLGVLCLFEFTAQAQKVIFSYDAAGNQQSRTWICVNCRPATGSKPEVTEIVLESVKKDDGTKIAKRKIIASPNPLVETLNLDWETEEGISIKNVKVYTIQGSRVHEISPTSQQKNASMQFQHLPVGTYILDITFSDKRKETIKVIKK